MVEITTSNIGLFTIISTGLVASDPESGTHSIIQTSEFVELLESRPRTRCPKLDAPTSERFDRDKLLSGLRVHTRAIHFRRGN